MTLRVTFLGTAGAVPTTQRNPSSIFVNRDGDKLLFDIGEGTQRQMMRYGTGFGISQIFITHLHGDHFYGLPGLLETFAINERAEPLTIHVPPRSRSDLVALITASGGDPQYPVQINEVTPGEVVFQCDEYEICAFRTDHRIRSVGYCIIEYERRGRFDKEKAVSLGVPEGPMFSQLHNGSSVELADGTVVEPEQVVGPPRPGRHVVYTGDTRPTDTVVEYSRDADLLIHDGTFGEDYRDRAVETAHATAREAGEMARNAGVRKLVLTHISSRYASDASRLADEARAVFDGEVVVAYDGYEFSVPFREA